MKMTREQANELLNALRSGADAPQRWINEALAATGDIDNSVAAANNDLQPD